MNLRHELQALVEYRFVLATALGVIVASAAGHHGWSTYDQEKTMTLTGVIQSSTYENPHGTMEFKASADGGKVWHTVLAPPTRMEARGLTRGMLKEGTTATVVGYPSKEKPNEMRAENVTINGKKVELR